LKSLSFATLIAADTFFLWMFFAAESVRAVATGREGASLELTTAASRMVATEWRHGMIGGWPFYMPGFFALTMAIAWWSRNGTWRRLLLSRLSALTVASLVAAWLTPLATPWLERLLVDRIGPAMLTTPLVVSWSTAARGWFTVGAWSVFVGLSVLAVQRRRPAAILGAVPGFVALHFTRSGEAGDLVQAWAVRAGGGEPEAWLTLALIPATAWGVAALALSGRHRGFNETAV
jgi:hypothetical protein